MFGKRKEFPPGTFIPTRTRVVVIIHLSLAFSLLVWFCFQPFMGELFAYRTEMTLYQTVMGSEQLLERVTDPTQIEEATRRLSDNRERFAALAEEERLRLQEGHDTLRSQVARTFWQKTTRALSIILFEIPLYLQGWILLSSAICILLLLRIEGAQMAAWLLPLLVSVYVIHNVRYGQPPIRPPDATLFPTEQMLLENFLDEELADGVWEQHDQLMRGWMRFLVIEWAKQKPATDETTFTKQVETGEYHFNIARIAAWKNTEPPTIERLMQGKRSLLSLSLFFTWNLFMAWYVNRRGALA
ncbi:hypothetical protein SCG7086_AM_00110 [Chlamydiales bacterium SCGC AG-110-P3]|nr:hypothetical protein SCG7086_AM_00110 [Chlamydiales bacterium SCGC AG-110-P3]